MKQVACGRRTQVRMDAVACGRRTQVRMDARAGRFALIHDPRSAPAGYGYAGGLIVNNETRLEELRWAIHGVKAPFSCDGTFVPDEPLTLVFRDESQFAVQRAENGYKQVEEVQPLIERCEPATFGDKRRTRFDRSVRDAVQLKAGDGGFSVEHFDPEAAGILDSIRDQMLPHDSSPITAELYALNVYTSGGHFAPHKDTPRGQDMFGTLVVCLPSQFWGGKFALAHRGLVKRLDWGPIIGKQQDANQLHWVAFFGDVDHQIERVFMGARVTITYLLRRDAKIAPSRTVADEELAPTILEAWRALLADAQFLPRGGLVGYPCCHLYHQDARFQVKQTPLDQRSAKVLKGRDQLVAATALQAGLDVSFAPYLFENCVDETWQLERFPTGKEQSRMKRRMDLSALESALPIRGESSEKVGDFGVTWLEPPPSSGSSMALPDSNIESSSELPAAGRLHSCEYCEWGYFGNEASDVDFYIYAALHVQFPKLGEGCRADVQPLRSATKKKTQSKKKSPGKSRKKKDRG